ncbi:MAG: hypothetical protein RL006_947 [Chloroflexota bacterium]|jgi:hypothetical protein
MSYHRVCCCSPSICVCTGCNFATSYTASGLSVNANWLHTSFGPPCSSPCTNYEESWKISWSVTASGTIPTRPLIRYPTEGGGCCYRATGYIEMSYTVEARWEAKCCAASDPVCAETKTITHTVNVPFCLSVAPICWNQIDCKWLHQIRICDAPLDVYELLAEPIDAADCGASLDCDNLPYGRYGVVVGGAVWSWITDYVALSTLNPIDFDPIGFCAPQMPCGCEPHSQSAGPFTVKLKANWGATPPTACDVTSSALYWGPWLDCSGGSSTAFCLGDGKLREQCCEIESNMGNWNPPTYT